MNRIKLLSLSIAGLLAGSCVTACQTTMPHARVMDKDHFAAGGSVGVTAFGAKGNGSTLNTQAIQEAVDYVASHGGGTVVIPKGTFLSGAIFLKPMVNLHLEEDGVLKGTTDVKDYPKMQTRIEGHTQEFLPALVNADKCDHLEITGDGTLDGSGQPFWDEFWNRRKTNKDLKNLDVLRPRLVFIENSKNVRVSGIHLLNSAFWNLHVYRCSDVVIDGLDVQAGLKSPSTDGTDIDSSQNVTIQNTKYIVNDDCIALKGSKGPLAMDDKDSPPLEHIRITHCTFTKGQGVVTLGSEATIVRDVEVDHCLIGPNANGMALARLKLRPDTPQLYENLRFHDITMDGNAHLISIQPWKQYFDLQGHAPPTRAVKDLTIENVKGTISAFGIVHANPGDVIENVTLRNINVITSPKAKEPEIVGVTNLVIQNVKINGSMYTGPKE